MLLTARFLLDSAIHLCYCPKLAGFENVLWCRLVFPVYQCPTPPFGLPRSLLPFILAIASVCLIKFATGPGNFHIPSGLALNSATDNPEPPKYETSSLLILDFRPFRPCTANSPFPRALALSSHQLILFSRYGPSLRSPLRTHGPTSARLIFLPFGYPTTWPSPALSARCPTFYITTNFIYAVLESANSAISFESMDCDDLDNSYSSHDDDDLEHYSDSSDSETIDDAEYCGLEVPQADGPLSLGMRPSYSAQSLPLALGSAWSFSSPPNSSSSFRPGIPVSAPHSPPGDGFRISYPNHNNAESCSRPDDSILKVSASSPVAAPNLPTSISSPLLRGIPRPSSAGPSSTTSCIPATVDNTYQRSMTQGTRAMSLDAAQLAHASEQAHNPSVPHTSSGTRTRVSFRLDLTALTSSKPMVRVISQPELNRHSIITTENVYKSSSSSAIYGVPSLGFGHYTNYPAGQLLVTQSHPDCRNVSSWPTSSGLASSSLGYALPSAENLPHSNAAATMPTFAQRQASLSRRLQVRPSVERLVQHNILFGPDLSPSISAAARAFRWRRRGDELNHRLSRRASRDSLIEHNILRADINSQTQTRFRMKQFDLANRIGSRSSRESLVQRNILVPQSASHSGRNNHADSSDALSPQTA